jgi:hypothetical protein
MKRLEMNKVETTFWIRWVAFLLRGKKGGKDGKREVAGDVQGSKAMARVISMGQFNGIRKQGG